MMRRKSVGMNGVNWAWFPMEFNFGANAKWNPGPDPTEICVEMHSDLDGNTREWKLSLSELVGSMLKGFRTRDGHIGAEHVRSAKAIRDGLRALADKIDLALSNVSVKQ